MEHIYSELAPLFITEAERGDHLAGHKLIHLIFGELKDGKLSIPIQCYLLDAMRRIAEGVDANIALNLKRARKRPPETERLIDWVGQQQ